MRKPLLLLAVIVLLGACASPAPETTPTPVPTSMPVPTNTPAPFATPTPPALTETNYIEPIRKQIYRELEGAEHAEVAKRWGISVDAAEEIVLEGLEKGWLMPERAEATSKPVEATPTPIPLPPAQPAVEIIPAATPKPVPIPTTPTEIIVGGYVKVVNADADGLRFRWGPGMDTVTKKFIEDGTILKVLDGPKEADGLTWWRLQDPAEENEDLKIGWAHDKWLQPTLVPEPVVLPNCPNPRARLTNPTVNAALKGAVEIRGSANIDDFDFYKFEVRHAGASEWSTLQMFGEPVADGFLGIWDTSALPAGAYKFRLVVVDKTGAYPEPCEVEVAITGIPVPPTPISPTVTPVPPTPIPPTATPPQGTPPPKVEAPMIAIPAGEFTMGSDHEIERPPHLVFVGAFEIDKFEVTNEQFERFVWETDYVTDAERAGDTSWRYYAEKKKGCKGGEGQYPVVKVTWNDAKAFCEWAGKRLPTEAEWEKAANGIGSLTYPWGNDWWDRGGNQCGGGEADAIGCCGRTCPGGSSPAEASPYCVMDMAGNVAEWTSDWFQPYPGYPGGDPVAQYFGEKYRVIRGGGWFSDKEHLRTTARSASSVTLASDDVGFRCVR